MNNPSPALVLAAGAALLLVAAAALARGGKRHGVPGFLAVGGALALVLGASAVVRPFLAPEKGMALLLVAFSTIALLARPLASLAARLAAARATPIAAAALTMLGLLGSLEWGAWFLTEAGWVPYFNPLKVVSVRGQNDWRLFHVTANAGVEADPILFWHPRPYWPYNSERLRGPKPVHPKPHDLVRVVAYGDSNTDGPPRGGAWAERLQERLKAIQGRNGHFYEVVNAGVTGYSSHQGLLRYRQQVEKLQPDVVLFSFGWNDASPALGKPDKEFQAPDPVKANLLRNAYRYRFFLAGIELVRPQKPLDLPTIEHRVTLEDYRDNLVSFIREARARGSVPVLLTRPHQHTESQMARKADWRGDVPLYNAVVRTIAVQTQTPVIDVQRFFEGRDSAFTDECHLTLDGHHEMAGLVYEHLERRVLSHAER